MPVGTVALGLVFVPVSKTVLALADAERELSLSSFPWARTPADKRAASQQVERRMLARSAAERADGGEKESSTLDWGGKQRQAKAGYGERATHGTTGGGEKNGS